MEPQEHDLSNVSNEDFGDIGSSSGSSDEDIEDDYSDSDNEDQKARKKAPPKKPKKVEKAQILFNVSDTQYDVVKYVGRKIFHWKLTYEKEGGDWDLFWTDCAVQPETLARMQTYQKINHFPGMYSLARKNHLGKNLMRMKKSFPDNFKFFPQTFLLPTEYSDFRNQFTKKKNKTFIVKPEASCQGRGIFLTRNYESIHPGEHYVVQRYLHKPFLIDGLKFDMRIYVLLAGCDPLKIFLFDDGLGRFATEPYVSPTGSNLDNVCMHLTNYAINKDSPNFVFNESSNADDVGHKRSLKAVFRTLKERGHDVDAIWKDIKKIIIKTFCSVQPILAHSYRSCHPDEPYNNMCFELLGFDVMLDHKLKPWLIEVNHTPSFTTDTPLDKHIKKHAIKDALTIMNISIENKITARNKKRAELQQRVLTGKKPKLTPEEKQAAFEKAQKERNLWEAVNTGRYEKIYPFDDPSQAEEDYEAFMKVANQWWEEWTGTRKAIKKTVDPNKPPPMVFGTGSSPPVTRKDLPKPKTMVPQKPGTSQGGKISQFRQNSIGGNPIENKSISVTENKSMEKIEEKVEEKMELEPENDSMPLNFIHELEDETTDFLAQIAEIQDESATDIVSEDHKEDHKKTIQAEPQKIVTEEPPKRVATPDRSLKPARSLPKAVSAVNSIEEKPKGNWNEPKLDYKAASYSSTTYINGAGSVGEPELRVDNSRNTSFKIRMMHAKNGTPLKVFPEQRSVDDSKSTTPFSKKFASFINVDKVEDLQMAVGAVPGRLSNISKDYEGRSDTKKIPLKLANGVIGHVGLGIHQVWSNVNGEVNSLDMDREKRGVSNSLYNKISVRSELHGRQNIKKGPSLSYQQPGRQVGNFLPPKVYEVHFSSGQRAFSPKVGGVPGVGPQANTVFTRHARGATEQREPSVNVTYFPNSQAAMQKYYNFLTNKK